ncbi:MAG: hypothetical protein P8R42_10790 [Candidatus Binatia bacterium]|nr:hypothetical protein [Candidatus Binatia bacterium]
MSAKRTWVVGWAAALVAGLILAGSSPRAMAEAGCTLYAQDTFPYGMVWWRVGGDGGRAPGIKGFPEGRTAYLITGVRPDGVLVQNREARYPRVLGWKVVGRSEISLDGRKTWQSGCAAK